LPFLVFVVKVSLGILLSSCLLPAIDQSLIIEVVVVRIGSLVNKREGTICGLCLSGYCYPLVLWGETDFAVVGPLIVLFRKV